jgi:excisionase family DNA binding protein
MDVTHLLTIAQFARATGLKYWLAWQLVKRRAIPSVIVGTRRRIDARWIQQWLETGGYRPIESNKLLGEKNDGVSLNHVP